MRSLSRRLLLALGAATLALPALPEASFAAAVFQKLADSTGGEGKFALFVGSLTVPLHNERANIGLA